jgi:hypothetical protein
MSCCDLINNPSTLPEYYPCSCPTPNNWDIIKNTNLLLSDTFQITNHNNNVSALRSLIGLKNDLINKNSKYQNTDLDTVKKNNDFDGVAYFNELNTYNKSIDDTLNNINTGLGFNLSIDDIVKCSDDKANISPCGQNNYNYIYIMVFIIIILIVFYYKYKLKKSGLKSSYY